jgi:hypothetical protein
MSETTKEPYQLSKCTVRIVITLLPSQDENGDRECLVAASTHDDLPVAQCVNFRDLQPLPPPIRKVLKQLKAELPKRKFNAEVKEFKAQKTTKPETSITTSETEKKQESIKSNQTTLFD